jgi:hypothetical protein
MTSAEFISRQISQCEEAFVVKAILVKDISREERFQSCVCFSKAVYEKK